MYSEENLMVLMYDDSRCRTTLVLPNDPRVAASRTTINAAEGTWATPNNGDPANPPLKRKIGESRYIDPNFRYGVIGVYDRTNFNHLQAMNSASVNAVDNTPAWAVD